MRIYPFEQIDDQLPLLTLCARRALDRAGLKVALAVWRDLPLATRRVLATLGSEKVVDDAQVRLALEGVPAEQFQPLAELSLQAVPPEVRAALGPQRPISESAWAALQPLDRYALWKVVSRGRPERIEQAYREIVGHSGSSPHLEPGGGVRMIDVGGKLVTQRKAVAETRIRMSAEALSRLQDAPKGDVIGTARVAAIMAAKRTSELIPLCHPVTLTRISVEASVDDQASAVVLSVCVEALDRTGVEMEAMTAASVAALTVYDMLKAFDKGMEIGPTRLVAKSGGRSGDFSR